MHEARRGDADPARLLGLLEGLPDGVLAMDGERSIVYANAAARRMYGELGASLEGPLARLAEEIEIHDAHGVRLPTKEWPLSRALRGRAFYGWTLRVRHLESGPVCWGSYSGQAHRSADGRVELGVVTVRDHTMDHRAEEGLKQSERLYRAIGETLDFGIWVSTPDGRWVYASDSFLRLVGAEQEECAGLGWARRLHPDERDETLAAWEACVKARASWDRECRFLGADGRYHPVLVRGVPVRDDEGRIGCWAGINLDIGRLKHVERELRETHRRKEELLESLRDNERQFHLLADTIPQLAWMARPDGHVLWYNRRWYEYTGTTSDQMEGWGWTSVHDPVELKRVLEGWRRALETGEPWEDVFPLRRHDGEMRWHLSRALPLRDDRGRVVRWFGTNTDITERRLLEERLRDADRRKDAFLATLAHELRNPLGAIRQAALVLGGESPTSTERSFATHVIDRQASQMGGLLDDLLDVTRIAHDRLELRLQPVQLSALLEDALATARPWTDCRRQSLEVRAPVGPLTLRVDRVRMAQVISNLLQNAAKYTPSAGRIELRVLREGRDVSFVVKDTGMGFATEKAAELFEMFNQLPRGLGASAGGLGLGLALVKRLVVMHGGTVTAHSDGEGRGSTFTVHLPGAVSEERMPDHAEAGGKEADAAAGLRVLVVDDQADAAESLALLLRHRGCVTETATDGTQALRKGDALRPDVVVLDIGLPDVDGYEIARRIRARAWGHSAILLALTGWGQEEDRAHALAAGFDGHFTKPTDPNALLARIAEARCP